MDFVKEAITQNTHWQSGEIAFPRTKRLIERDIFPTAQQALKNKYILMLRGLRRTGKSTLARQLLQKIIERTKNAREVCWFEFDRSMGAGPEELDSLLKFFESRGAKLIVLDEVMFVKQWQDVLKRHYDLTDVKFIVTGSSALEMDRRSSESLAGRFKLLKITPFSFREYLQLSGSIVPQSELELVQHSGEMETKCYGYVRNGGLPEEIGDSQKERVEYIRSALLDPVFFKDVPIVFPNSNPDLLLKTLELLCPTVSSTFQFQTIAQVLGVSHPVIATQVEILEKTLLVKTSFNYSGSKIKQKRTAKKISVADNGILTTLYPEISIGALAENLAVERRGAGYFWRDKKGREVDIILPDKKLAIEVKYRNHITSEDEKNLQYFLANHTGWQGLIITKNEEKEGKINRIPLWKWLL